MNIINKPVIGVSGVAGCGKDTFCSLLIKKLSELGIICKNYPLAYELKEELKDFCISHYNIDPTNCSREQKNKIRDLLVFHGNYKRSSSLGRYWNEKIERKILLDTECNIFTVSDIRYNLYDYDEFWWLKKRVNGILVHITQYHTSEDGCVFENTPANIQEKENDPIMKKLADYKILWPKISDDLDLNTKLEPYINDFINYLKKLNII